MKTPFKLPARLPPRACLLIIPLALITGCASLPTGPRVAVMPAPGKPLDLFTMEDRQCRNYADQSIGIAPREVANQNMVGSAVVGTAIGAAAGALAGGNPVPARAPRAPGQRSAATTSPTSSACTPRATSCPATATASRHPPQAAAHLITTRPRRPSAEAEPCHE